MHEALLTSGKGDTVWWAFMVARGDAYWPFSDEPAFPGKPRRETLKAHPSTIHHTRCYGTGISNGSMESYCLLPQGRCKHCVQDKDQRERHAQDLLASGEQGHSG